MNQSLGGVSRDRLQPALLDRLIDHNPGQSTETAEDRVISKAKLRECVLRDLSLLLNTTAHWGANDDCPHWVRRSVLNYGIPPLAGQYVSKLELSDLERELFTALRTFEPRLLADTLVVRGLATEDEVARHNVLQFEIQARLWAEPYPLELLLRTQFDVETGAVQIDDVTASNPVR